MESDNEVSPSESLYLRALFRPIQSIFGVTSSMPAARNPISLISLSFSGRKVSKEIQLVTGAEVIQ